MPRRWLLIAVTVAFVLAGAVVAVASPSSAPVLKAPPGFRPWWSETPGKYYWQASHSAPMCLAKGCVVVSAIHTFRVVP